MLFSLDDTPAGAPFPDPSLAETEPDGLLAIGGDLSSERIIQAYRQGIFPWYSETQPILWWSPDPRMVLFPHKLRINRSLNKVLRRNCFELSVDRAFPEVIEACAQPRADDEGTWLMPEMIVAYNKLHRLGVAHSVEAWQNGELVGGLYGNALGRVFFGESMFTRVANASKVAFATLVQALHNRGYEVIDCQVFTAHLQSLGAEMIPRQAFLQMLNQSVNQETDFPDELSCA